MQYVSKTIKLDTISKNLVSKVLQAKLELLQEIIELLKDKLSY